MIEDIEQLIGTAVSEVFGTMLNLPVAPEPKDTPIKNGEPHVASSVGFIGRLTGVVFLYSTNSFAKCMTSKLLGLEEHEVDGDEMVNDAMGELANMVVGNIKSRLSDRGMPCVLTIPSIVRGQHLSIEPVSSTQRRVFSFQSHKNQLVVELLLKDVTSAEQASRLN
ncbi:MAG TPA: chemotaxis protein CheX [Verrucomicrobiae bacterium]